MELFKQFQDPQMDLQMGVIQNFVNQKEFVLILKEILLFLIPGIIKFEKSQKMELLKQLLDRFMDLKMGMLQNFIIQKEFVLIIKEISLWLTTIESEKSQERRFSNSPIFVKNFDGIQKILTCFQKKFFQCFIFEMKQKKILTQYYLVVKNGLRGFQFALHPKLPDEIFSKIISFSTDHSVSQISTNVKNSISIVNLIDIFRKK